MNKSNTTQIKSLAKSVAAFGLTVVLAMAAASAQLAGAEEIKTQINASQTGIDASSKLASEKAACQSGATQQSRADCLLEAKNANADKKAGIQDKAGERYQANALARCERLKGDDQLACQARVMGYGTTAGSVAGGGVITEVETVVLPKDGGAVRLPQ